jgi:hypothetical protein
MVGCFISDRIRFLNTPQAVPSKVATAISVPVTGFKRFSRRHEPSVLKSGFPSVLTRSSSIF